MCVCVCLHLGACVKRVRFKLKERAQSIRKPRADPREEGAEVGLKD